MNHFSRKLEIALTTTMLFVALSLSPAQAQDDAERGDRGIVLSPTDEYIFDAEKNTTPGAPLNQVLPPLPSKLPQHSFSDTSRVVVSQIILEGNTVLPENEVAELIASYDNRPTSIEEIQDLRYRLSEMYLQLGYVNSGVVLPDQRVDDGIIRLQAIEGALTDIDITGNHSLFDSYIEKRIRRGADTPLNAVDLQQALKVLQLDPRIAQINAQLLPGTRAGESMLQVSVVENVNYWVSTAVDNYRSPSVDENRVSISAGNGNFIGFGDALSVNYGVTEGLDDLDASYSVPLTSGDLRLAAYYQSTDSNVVEEPFDVIDIQSQSETFGVALSRPFRSNSGRAVTATLGFENRSADNWLLGVPFSFTPGEQDGTSSVSVAYLTAATLWQSPKQIVGLTVTGRFGVDVLEPTINVTEPDSRFTSVRAQFQYARVLGWRDSEFSIRSSAQFTSDSLLALEKFAVGGHTTVRGYRENQLVRDNGFVASVELRFPLFVDREGREKFGLQLVPFIDYGVSWDNDDALPTSNKDDIESIGLGVRWRPTPNWVVWADYGYALTDVVTPTESLQDKGFQFRVEYRATPSPKY